VIRPEEAQRPYTVTELANEIRRELRPLTALLLKGEVSGMKQGSKGHYSFVIRDGQSLINAFIYADDASQRCLKTARSSSSEGESITGSSTERSASSSTRSSSTTSASSERGSTS